MIDVGPKTSRRAPFMALALLSLLAALWAALARIGWGMPPLSIPIAGQHGPLMVSGFLGTLISVERVVALRWRRAYAVPILSGLGAVALFTGLSPVIGRGLITLASIGLALMLVWMIRTRPAAYVFTMGIGGLMWLTGNLLWLSDGPVYRAAPWWAGFLILTIAGERLELARVLAPGGGARKTFIGVIAIFVSGLLVSLVDYRAGLALAGIGLSGLGAWLLRNDVARLTIRQSGLTRFIAACLLPGYVWLIIGGILWLAFGGTSTAGFAYDALLHAVFLGFVFSMIFGHAPIIIPAVVPIDIDYRPLFYAQLVLLQMSLVVRILGDLSGQPLLRMWGGLFNVLAVLLFLAAMARSARRRP